MKKTRGRLLRWSRLAAILVSLGAVGLATLELRLSGPLGISVYLSYRALRNSVRDGIIPSPPSLASFANSGPNVVIVVLDCFRFDYLDGAAPTLREFASRAWSFDRYYASAPWTKPSTASLFTGLVVRRHFVVRTDSPLPAQALTLAEVLRDHGYTTVGLTWHNPHLSRRQGFDQGFDTYFDDVRPRGSKGLLHRFLSWLAEEQPDRFFAYVHFEGTHDPYPADNTLDVLLSAPEYASDLDFTNVDYKEEVKKGRALSPDEAAHLGHLARGKARKVDRLAVRELLIRFENSPLRDNTILIVTADHGDGFYEHGTVSHGGSLFEEEIHVPLVVSFPERFARERGFPQNGRSSCPASTVDLFPTVLDFVGIPAPSGIDGNSVIPQHPPRDSCSRAVVSERFENDRLLEAAIVSRSLKLIVDHRSGDKQLYDLESDAAEVRDLAKERAEAAASLAADLANRLNSDGSSMAPWIQAAPVAVPEEDLERLRALGYVD